nr:integrase, catalytic region, zinc finger, CCHC-type, peptidase aspartic, catalytic [Tanacetum cinerariifolium]
FQQTRSLKPYVSTVILEKIIIDLEDEVVSLLDKEKENLKSIEFLKSKDVETGVVSSEKVVSQTENKSENDCQVIEKVCDCEENPNVIAPEMFKLSVSQSVSPISVTKTSCASNSVETKLKRKRRKRTSSKHNVNQVNSVVSRANKDFVHFSDLDTFNSFRRPKPSDFLWKKKRSSNTVKANLYTRSAFDCNNARNALCNARRNDFVDVNDLFVFDDIVQICLWIIDSGCSKHVTDNHAHLTNFVEKFLRTVRFGNNDFVVITGYGDVVIGSMTIKRVYYVEGL